MPGTKGSDAEGTKDTKQVSESDMGEAAFSDAFEEAVEGKPPAPGDKADLHKADDPGIEEEKSIDKVVDKSVDKPVIPAAKPDAPQPKEDEETYKQRYLTLQGIVKHDKSEWEKEKTSLLSQVEEAKKPKTPKEKQNVEEKETASADAFIASLTPEEQEQLNQYEADFDVVSKMEGIKRTRELTALRKEIDEWKKGITTQLTEAQARMAPVVKMAEDNEVEAHFNLIRGGYAKEDGIVVAGHPDFDKYRDDGSMVAWIESKPAYIQAALKKVYEKGKAVDVIDLYADFKRENNIETANTSTDNVVDMSPRRADKKAALQAVQNRRGAINTAKPVADDYDSAFDEAANK